MLPLHAGDEILIEIPCLRSSSGIERRRKRRSCPPPFASPRGAIEDRHWISEIEPEEAPAPAPPELRVFSGGAARPRTQRFFERIEDEHMAELDEPMHSISDAHFLPIFVPPTH